MPCVLIGRDVADALAQYGFPISKASLGQRVAYAESAVNPSGKTVLIVLGCAMVLIVAWVLFHSTFGF